MSSINPRSEKALQKLIVKLCGELQILCYKFASPAKRGVPDLLLFNKHGIGGFIEVKNPLGTGRLSPLQVHELEILDKQNVYTYVIKDASTAEKTLRLFATYTQTRRRH